MSIYTREAQETDVVLADTAEITLTAVGSETGHPADLLLEETYTVTAAEK